MTLRNGVYVSKVPFPIAERHGGYTEKLYFHRYLCIFPGNQVAYYGGGASRNFFDPYHGHAFDMMGRISPSEKQMILRDKYTDDIATIRYEHVNDGLNVEAIRKNHPGEIWFEGEFEYMGMPSSEGFAPNKSGLYLDWTGWKY